LKEVVSEFADSANITGGLKVDTITTTGNVDISGDLVVNDVNIITELGTKQPTITTTTDLTSNSITTIGSGTIGGNLTISGDLVIGTTNVITEIGTKQDTIQDNGLTIAKTDGLQTA